MDTHPDQVIEGVLDQVLYVNDTSGYSVAVIECDDDEGAKRRITVVGNLAAIAAGSGIRAQNSSAVRQGGVRGRAPGSIRARARGSWRRLSHGRRGRGKTRHPAQLDPARPRRDRVPARTDGR